MCRECGGTHGDELQERVTRACADGKFTADDALMLMLVDDAHLCGTLALVREPGDPGLGLRVMRCPRPWEVYVSRAFARGESPDLGGVVQRAIAPYFGHRADDQGALQDLRAEILEALVFLDPDIVDAEIEVKRSTIRPDELAIAVRKRTNVEPGARVMSPGVEIPAEVYGRKPAQA
jgi:hypothetical protein